jgi:hypothetical protein
MSVKNCLKKSLFSLFVAGLVLASINVSGAQILSAIPGCGNVDIGSVKVAPFVQVGYKNIGLNFNLPTPSSNVFGTATALDLKFRDAGVWVGSIGLDAHPVSKLFLTLRADGNASKNIDVFTGENVPYFDIKPLPYTWRGSQLQWWDIDGMAGYTFCKDWSALIGLRYDKLTVGLKDPVDATGAPWIFPNQTVNIWGDVLVKTWIPYIGLQFNGTNYSGLLLYSPFASTQVVTPQTFFNDASPDFFEHFGPQWEFSNSGSFLEAYFAYNVPVLEAFQIGLWAKGTWMRFNGEGTWSGPYYETLGFFTTYDSLSATGNLSTYGLSGGVTASLSF